MQVFGLRFNPQTLEIEMIQQGIVVKAIPAKPCEKQPSDDVIYKKIPVRNGGLFTLWEVAAFEFSKDFNDGLKWIVAPNPFTPNEWIATGIIP